MVTVRIRNWDSANDLPEVFISDPAGRIVAPRESALRVAWTGFEGQLDVAAFLFQDVSFQDPGPHTITFMLDGLPFAGLPLLIVVATSG